MRNLFFINELGVTEQLFRNTLALYQAPVRGVQGTYIKEYHIWNHTDHTRATGYGYRTFKTVAQRGSDEEEVLVHHMVTTSFIGGLTDAQRESAKRKVIEKLQSSSSIQWGVEIAEFRRNLAILKDAIKTLILVKSALQKGNIKGLENLLNMTSATIASPYLFYTFGIKPIISTIRDVSELLVRPFAKITREKYTGSSRVWHEHVIQEAEALSVDLWRVTLLPYKVREFTGYDYVVARSPKQFQSLHDILAYLQPGAVFWELIPYSFVVDYFTNIFSEVFTAPNDDFDVEVLTGSRVEGNAYLGFAETKPSYKRTVSPYLPSSSFYITFDVSGHQLFTMLALTLQRLVPNHKPFNKS